jgi:Domain of unknown function (DUF4917)
MALPTYDEIIKQLQGKRRPKHLLLGNGFSMAYDKDIFSYNALSNFIENTDNQLLKKLFNIINTKNFELIMQQLENFCALAREFSKDEDLEGKIRDASESLKSSLIDAIQKLHPEHVFMIPEEKSRVCASLLNLFLSEGGHVFTTNYDILLYWVLMRNSDMIKNPIDGFGREVEDTGEYVPEDELEFSELIWGKHKEEQNVHYLHGALPLFDTGTSIIKEEYDPQNYLLEKIKQRVENKDYPVFVTAGNGKEKLTHIRHNQYLTFCYEQLCTIEGSLITFGFNFGQYDEHIIKAINIAAKPGKKVSSKLWSVYIGIYSDDDQRHIESIKDKFKCKVNLYDAKTVNIWGS